VKPEPGLERIGSTIDRIGEGPVWDASGQNLVWVDITSGLVRRYRPATGETTTLEVGCHVGALAVRAEGGLVLAAQDGFRLLEPGGGPSRLIRPIGAADPERRLNDGKCDPAGRFWAGTMRYDKAADGGALYCLEPDGQLSIKLPVVTISNGLDWSPDGRTMYYVDTPTQRVDAFDFDPATGTLGERRAMVTIDPADGNPDGLTVDAEGFVWLALWRGWAVRRYAPDGRLVGEIRLPTALVTSVAFGGPHLDELYVTTASEELDSTELAGQPEAGALFRIKPGVRGRPANSFAG
jgi:sugar lactone lactonase YvrE